MEMLYSVHSSAGNPVRKLYSSLSLNIIKVPQDEAFLPRGGRITASGKRRVPTNVHDLSCYVYISVHKMSQEHCGTSAGLATF